MAFSRGGLGLVELAAHVDVAGLAVDGVGRNDAALDELMGIVLHEEAVLVSPRLPLVRVDAEVARLVVLGQEAPLHPGREAGPAAPAQVGLLHRVDDCVRLPLQEVLQLGVAAPLLVDLDGGGVLLEDVLQEDRLPHVLRPGERPVLEVAGEDLLDVARGRVLDPAAVHLHAHRAAAAGQALAAVHRPLAVGAGAALLDAEAVAELRDEVVRAVEGARDVGADLDLAPTLRPEAVHRVEAGRVVHLRRRELEERVRVLDGRRRDVALLRLDEMQGRKEGGALDGIAGQDLVEARLVLGGEFHAYQSRAPTFQA